MFTESAGRYGKDIFYRFVRVASRTIALLCFRFRCHGREHLPQSGGAILLSTHQSMLDPVLVGLIVNGRLNYIARKTLFKNKLFAFLIRVLDAIEIDRERGGLAGLREMLKRLQKEKMVLIFPEGTRTETGEILALKMGFAPIARRSNVPLIPIAIVGANQILPRGSFFPSSRPLSVVVGPPISSAEVAKLSDEDLQKRIDLELRKCKAVGDRMNLSAY